MRKWIIITVILLGAAAISATHGQQRNCNNAIDWVVQARELARPGLSRPRLERMKVLLVSATSTCSDYGDAWYYRALYARELGDQSDNKFALGRAERFDSEALRQRDDPFAPVSPVPAPAPVTTAAPVKADPTVPAAAPAAKPRTFPPVREKWAVVIGISEFQYNEKFINLNNKEQDTMNLAYPAKDAKDFYKFLTDPNSGRFKPSNVTLLTNKEATVKRIKVAIGEMMDKVQPDDLMVCYISTHGSPRLDGQKEVNYIVTHDTEVANLYATSLEMVRVVDDLRYRIKAQRVVLFLDTCFSGAAATRAGIWAEREGAKELGTVGMGVSQEVLSRVDRDTGRVIITASKDNELSWESDQLKNGIFTYYLIQALKQDNGEALIEKVYNYLSEQVPQRVRAERGVAQTPVMHGNTLQGQLDIRIGIAPQSR